MKLHMSEADIVCDYKSAADKKAMIQILIDQNPGATKEDILEVLERHGCKVGWFKASQGHNFGKKKITDKVISQITVKEVQEEDEAADYEPIALDQEEPEEIQAEKMIDELDLTLIRFKEMMPEIPASIEFLMDNEIKKLESSILKFEEEIKKIKAFRAFLEIVKGS